MINLKCANIPDSHFDPDQLALGIRIESEHTDNPAVAKAIAKAHLTENKWYYTYLVTMENVAEEQNKRMESNMFKDFNAGGLDKYLLQKNAMHRESLLKANSMPQLNMNVEDTNNFTAFTGFKDGMNVQGYLNFVSMRKNMSNPTYVGQAHQKEEDLLKGVENINLTKILKDGQSQIYSNSKMDQLWKSNNDDLMSKLLPLYKSYVVDNPEEYVANTTIPDLMLKGYSKQQAETISKSLEKLSKVHYEKLEKGSKVPKGGVIQKKSNGKWGVISGKTGKFWPANYDSEADAHAGLKGYFANK